MQMLTNGVLLPNTTHQLQVNTQETRMVSTVICVTVSAYELVKDCACSTPVNCLHHLSIAVMTKEKAVKDQK